MQPPGYAGILLTPRTHWSSLEEGAIAGGANRKSCAGNLHLAACVRQSIIVTKATYTSALKGMWKQWNEVTDHTNIIPFRRASPNSRQTLQFEYAYSGTRGTSGHIKTPKRGDKQCLGSQHKLPRRTKQTRLYRRCTEMKDGLLSSYDYACTVCLRAWLVFHHAHLRSPFLQ